MADCAKTRASRQARDLLRREGIVSTLVVPISRKGHTTGLLYVANRRETVFSQQDEDTLNHLATQAAIAIENARLYEEVTKHAEDLENKVEERTRELQETNRRLETASRHKSEFLANMSHELRTPLNAIIGFTRLVMRRSKEVLPAKQYENLEKIHLSADQLLLLINDVLDLSKVEAGKMDVRPVSFQLESMIDICLRTVEPMVKPEQIQLAKDLEPDLPQLVTDQDKLKQIVMNLLSNAIKFTEAGTITVSARRHGDRGVAGGHGPGHRHSGGRARADFRGVPPGRQQQHAPARRHRPRAFHQPALRAPAGRRHHRSEQARPGLDLHARPSPCATSASCPRPQSARQWRVKPAASGTNGKVMLAIDDDPDAIYLCARTSAMPATGWSARSAARRAGKGAGRLRPFAITLDLLMAHRNGWDVLRDLKADPVDDEHSGDRDLGGR